MVFGSAHPSTFYIAFGDGSFRTMSYLIEVKVHVVIGNRKGRCHDRRQHVLTRAWLSHSLALVPSTKLRWLIRRLESPSIWRLTRCRLRFPPAIRLPSKYHIPQGYHTMRLIGVLAGVLLALTTSCPANAADESQEAKALQQSFVLVTLRADRQASVCRVPQKRST